MNKQTISQDQEAPPQPYLVSSVFSSTIYKTLGTRMAIPITPRESSRVLQIQQKWYFSAKKSFFFNLRSSEQKIQEHGKGALLFSSFLFFHFFQFLVSSSFIFWSLILQKQEPDRKVYVFWKEAITADLASSDSASFFEKVRLPFSIMVSPVKSVLLKNI